MSQRFLARNNLDRHTGLAILKQLRLTQRADDVALAERAKLMNEMLVAGLDTNLAIDRTHPVIVDNMAVMNKLIEAREMTIGMHSHLAGLGKSVGIDLRAEGCGASCGNPSVQAVAISHPSNDVGDPARA